MTSFDNGILTAAP